MAGARDSGALGRDCREGTQQGNAAAAELAVEPGGVVCAVGGCRADPRSGGAIPAASATDLGRGHSRSGRFSGGCARLPRQPASGTGAAHDRGRNAHRRPASPAHRRVASQSCRRTRAAGGGRQRAVCGLSSLADRRTHQGGDRDRRDRKRARGSARCPRPARDARQSADLSRGPPHDADQSRDRRRKGAMRCGETGTQRFPAALEDRSGFARDIPAGAHRAGRCRAGEMPESQRSGRQARQGDRLGQAAQNRSAGAGRSPCTGTGAAAKSGQQCRPHHLARYPVAGRKLAAPHHACPLCLPDHRLFCARADRRKPAADALCQERRRTAGAGRQPERDLAGDHLGRA